ncbi:MAG: ATP-binding cassette domain-containing protein [Planctomycetota bacterium]
MKKPVHGTGVPDVHSGNRVNGDVAWLVVREAAHNNLQKIDVGFPLGRFTCVTGVSGSGKSSLVNDILYAALARDLNRATTVQPGRHAGIEGLAHLDKIIAIDQAPIGRTPRSNPATYIKVFDEIRTLYAKLPDAKLRGYKPGRFSFNVAARRGGGRCEACEGNGANRIEMDFLADVWVTCPVCEGQRFNRETLQVHYKGKSITDVLEMDVQDALGHFENVPRTRAMLQTLHDVGLDYIKIGQPSTTLSGGEAQRIKLARELVKKATGRTLYVLDEPTTGLHFDDIRRLLTVLHGFVDAGNTVVVIEHNLDVIKTADWVIDLGPEGGEEGGCIVAEGTPEDVAACRKSYTGVALRAVLGGGGPKVSSVKTSASKRASTASLSASRQLEGSDLEVITVEGARQHNLKDLTVSFPRDQITVCTGVSGSGKTSFAIDTVFTEGHRRYVESLSAYARQFLGQMAKPRVDRVSGLSPAICIEQKSAGKSPRSTVGTITEVYDYMRVLWARIGQPYCPRCQVPIGSQTVDEIVARVMELEPGAPIIILAPVVLGESETYAKLFNRLKSSGYTRMRIDGEIQLTTHATTLDARRKHRVEVVVDRTIVRKHARGRIAESVEHALALGNGVMTLLIEAVEIVEEDESVTHVAADDSLSERAAPASAQSEPEAPARIDLAPAHKSPNQIQGTNDGIHRQDAGATTNVVADGSPAEQSRHRIHHKPERELMFSQKLACTQCSTSFEEQGPHQFSFNSQLGWCETCEGLGVQRGAPAEAIIKRPSRGLLEGAIDGWDRVRRATPFGRLLAALCRHIGVEPETPLRDWTPAQKRVLMFGMDASVSRTRGATAERWIDADQSLGGVRFRWQGFFPTIDAATRNSWWLRHRLHNVVTDIPCVTCQGGRLRTVAAAVRVGGDEKGSNGKTIVEVCEMPLSAVGNFLRHLKLDSRRRQIAGELLKEIRNRLQFLLDVGLDYLTLHRAAPTLSGGEAQRIRLASQIGSGLSGVLYVLDEPTIGLHPRDNLRLIKALRKLRNLGNTVLMVEHDREVIRQADRLLDFGPRAGSAGGQIVAQGPPTKFLTTGSAPDSALPSLTQAYLTGSAAIPIPANRRPVRGVDEALKQDSSAPRRRRMTKRQLQSVPAAVDPETPHGWLVVRGARQNNLKNIDVPIPLRRFTCVTGVSGSGKSSLVNDILWPALACQLQRATLAAGDHDQIDGIEQLGKVIDVDQSPIGSTPSSNPATYTGTFDWIRELFARLPDSKMRGYGANRFSFNRPGGRCEACQGYGQKCIEMHFMPDVWVECETCQGRRYNQETLDVRYKGKSVADVLDMRIVEALELFGNVPRVKRMLQTLVDVGLDYVQLGQPAPTLSGGEAQRVKLATELGKPDIGNTFYILDEPTTGLHFDDVHKLLSVIHRLVDLGNTVLVVEHNLDVIKSADWIIDLGPEAGEDGGYIVAAGTPEEVVKSEELRVKTGKQRHPRQRSRPVHPNSDFAIRISQFPCHTAIALAPVLAAGPREERMPYDPAAHADRELAVAKAGYGDVGKNVKMPWQVDGRKWHLSQRTSRGDQPRQWESAALEYVIEVVEKSGPFAPADWSAQASVEVTAAQAQTWFLHALTGGEWLLELYFRAPAKTFDWRKLDADLGLKTLDEREDLQTYGDWSRVDVRPRSDGYDAVVIYVHDKKEINTLAFRKFVKQAVRAYLKSQGIPPNRTRRKSK